jgi:hypothetical protein
MKLKDLLRAVEKVAVGGTCCVSSELWGPDCKANNKIRITWFSQIGENNCESVTAKTVPLAFALFKATHAKIEAERRRA